MCEDFTQQFQKLLGIERKYFSRYITKNNQILTVILFYIHEKFNAFKAKIENEVKVFSEVVQNLNINVQQIIYLELGINVVKEKLYYLN